MWARLMGPDGKKNDWIQNYFEILFNIQIIFPVPKYQRRDISFFKLQYWIQVAIWFEMEFKVEVKMWDLNNLKQQVEKH